MNKEPIRMCLICRQHKTKQELIRLIKQDNSISIDKSYKQNCRGAYICKNKDCFEKLKKQKALNRIFKFNVDEIIYKEIEDLIGK